MKLILHRMLSLFVLPLLVLSLVFTPQMVLADAAEEEETSAKEEALTAPTAASAESNGDLLDKISQLNKRVEELETKLAEKAAPSVDSDKLKLLEDRLAAQEKIASTAGPGGFSLDSLPAGAFLKDTKISGFVDTSYTFNFNQPHNLSNNSNGTSDNSTNDTVPSGVLPYANLHPFDRDSNAFNINMVELSLERAADPVGFRVDLDFGTDAEVIHSVGMGTAQTVADPTFPPTGQNVVATQINDLPFDLQQAYVQYKLPMDKLTNSWKCLDGLTGNIMMGKFVTMSGAEVIESKDNWNFSRSLLFANAIPFTHTGVRSNWNYKGWLDTSFGVNNGWDQARDLNQAKSIESRLGITPTDWISGGIIYLAGSETLQKSGNRRDLIDVVTTLKNPWKEIEALNKLTLMFNMDWAREINPGGGTFDESGYGVDGVARVPSNFGDTEARWHGYAAYAKYDLFPWWYIANRLEYFQDTDGSRTLRQQDLWEYTLTNSFTISKNLTTRLEYRHDGADKPIFGKSERFISYQDIVYLEAIVAF